MKAEQAWQAARGQLQIEMPKAAFDTWVHSAELVSYEDGSFVIGVQNAYARDWLHGRLSSTVKRLLTGIMNRTVEVRFIVWQDENEQSEIFEENFPIEEPASRKQNSSLNPRYSFDNFIVGSSNRLAHAASLAVAENPSNAYNPLFVYGGVGLGKTHLLHAIGNMCHQHNLSVLYVSSEEFTNDLISAIRAHHTQDFREKYRYIDVLLIDDIQFIAGKESTQEEFFHTFNTLQSTGRQVVFTSDARPADIPGLEERLRSRFLQGLLADIQPPDLETRCAILREKARAVGRDLAEDVVLFISRRVQNNVRELEGCLNRTIAYAQLKNAKITVDVVRMALYELLPDERATSPSDIIRFVAQHYGIRVADLKGRSNRRSIALPRQVAMYLIRNILELSFPEIGKIFSKHHSTVMYAVDNVQKMRQSNPDFDSTLTSFREHFV